MSSHRRVPFSYLDRQFSELENFLEDVRQLVLSGQFTLGPAVEQFEHSFAELSGLPCAIGVGTGTDAIALSLKALGIGPGAEVITTPMTFIATVGAIVQTGARPIFVDSEDGFVLDPDRLEDAITARTRAIVPVHYTGNVADMPTIAEIARRHDLRIVEDACQATVASLNGSPVGSWGDTAAFSLHPLKNLNVWGDGGVILTKDRELAASLRSIRNHGLLNREVVGQFGVNSRLDALQALVGSRLIPQTQALTERRIAIAGYYDDAFAQLSPELSLPVRRPGVRHVFHLYMVRSSRRDALLEFLLSRGIEAKIHYPTPVHLQPAAVSLGYPRGSFPKCESDCQSILTLPAHPYLRDDEVSYVVEEMIEFHRRI